MPLHRRRVCPPGLLQLPAHALESLESRLYPEPKGAPRRPGVLRVQVCQNGPRGGLTRAPDGGHRPPNLSLLGSERRSPPDEGAVGSANQARARVRVPPSGQNTALSVCPMRGCQPSERMAFHSFGLLNPLSAITIRFMREGIATDSNPSNSTAGAIHPPGLLPGMTTHATGMAHPR